MDSIRKKMQSLKSETDGLYATIQGFEDATAEAVARANQVSFILNNGQQKESFLQLSLKSYNK